MLFGRTPGEGVADRRLHPGALGGPRNIAEHRTGGNLGRTRRGKVEVTAWRRRVRSECVRGRIGTSVTLSCGGTPGVAT